MISRFIGMVLFALLMSAGSLSAQDVSEQEAYEIAKDAYVYAYPLILTHTTLQKLSNFAEPIEGDAFGRPTSFIMLVLSPTPRTRSSSRERRHALLGRYPRSQGRTADPLRACD